MAPSSAPSLLRWRIRRPVDLHRPSITRLVGSGQTALDASRELTESYEARARIYIRFGRPPGDLYCGVSLVGGFCKRHPFHPGDHACS